MFFLVRGGKRGEVKEKMVHPPFSSAHVKNKASLTGATEWYKAQLRTDQLWILNIKYI